MSCNEIKLSVQINLFPFTWVLCLTQKIKILGTNSVYLTWLCWNIDNLQIVSWTTIGFVIALYEIHNFFLFFTSSDDFFTKQISEYNQLRNKYTHLQLINGKTFYFIFLNEPTWLNSWFNKQLSLYFSFFTFRNVKNSYYNSWSHAKITGILYIVFWRSQMSLLTYAKVLITLQEHRCVSLSRYYLVIILAWLHLL